MIELARAEDWLKGFKDNSKDGCISDFPYGLKFMGKKWDYDLPSIEALSEIYRVLKPGAFLLGFSSSRTYHRLAVRLEDVGFELRDCIMWLYGSGFPKSLNISKAFDKEQASEIAKQWNGWGTCLKPAYEPIVVAMKPLDGTFIENAEKHGVAGLNIDGCRIPVNAADPEMNRKNPRNGNTLGTHGIYGAGVKMVTGIGENGRFPANIMIDEEVALQIDQQSGIGGGDKRLAKQQTGNNSDKFTTHKEGSSTPCYQDIGGASRFFYCAKSSPSDRNYGLSGKKNDHPTVKPISLTRYLARLIKTPFADAQYINPYSGSGTDMIGFILEGMNVEGCEMEEHNYQLAKERIEYAIKNTNTQQTLF